MGEGRWGQRTWVWGGAAAWVPVHEPHTPGVARAQWPPAL